MRKYIVGIAVGVLLTSAVVVLAGSLNPPAGPTEAGGQMYTLEQIHDRLDTGVAATKMTQFTKPDAGPGETMHTLDEIYDLIGERAFVPKTGQTKCYNASGTEIACADTGQDGDHQKGVAWPAPRFITGTTGVVTDTLTGLVWLENANCAGSAVTWTLAISYSNALHDGCANCFGTAGDCDLSDGSLASDWRLPNVRELHSLIHSGQANSAAWLNGQGFTDVWPNFYWSSTTQAQHTLYAWYVSLGNGSVLGIQKTNTCYVWPVRGGQ